MKLTYGEILGSDRLRDAIAGLYERQGRDNVVVTHGTIGANMLVHQALVSRGDRVVAVVPTYQQHYSIPESLGADVVPLRLRPKRLAARHGGACPPCHPGHPADRADQSQQPHRRADRPRGLERIAGNCAGGGRVGAVRRGLSRQPIKRGRGRQPAWRCL